jgi:hypothetical protein
MRDREDDSEEDGQPISLQVVVDDEPDRVMTPRGRGHCVLHAAILVVWPGDVARFLGREHQVRGRDRPRQGLQP